MKAENEFDVLYIACEMERRGIMMYRRAQTLDLGEAVLSLLKRLEDDEMRHLKQFSQMLEGAPQEDLGEKRVLFSAYAQKILLSGGVMELAREKAFESWENLIAYAIKDEAHAVKTYDEFSRVVKDALAKNMFLLVRDEEQTHLDELTALREQQLQP